MSKVVFASEGLITSMCRQRTVELDTAIKYGRLQRAVRRPGGSKATISLDPEEYVGSKSINYVMVHRSTVLAVRYGEDELMRSMDAVRQFVEGKVVESILMVAEAGDLLSEDEFVDVVKGYAGIRCAYGYTDEVGSGRSVANPYKRR
ncbi:MAG: hypothetical protein ACE37K_20320 [Planctomycetota bacterium]